MGNGRGTGVKQLSENQIKEFPKLEQSAMVELFTLDLSAFGGEVYNLCNQLNEKGQPIIFAGISYTPYPIDASGFATNSQGASTRPTLSVSNMYGLVTALVDGNGVVGAKVTRQQVYARHLDAINFINGNEHADSNAVAPSFYVVETIKSLNKNLATFELAIPSESDGVKMPRRIIISNTSPSAYKGSTGVLAYRED
ncbi:MULTISPECIES: phage minor tail protein L [Pasteurellaceae]|uniref:Phage minor tail protein L n=1 Tax=Pasteurella atlantica TaxID=2827233 RepID=A0AAW8CQG0_9PAST|nr:phage minor tail protein L [Pasteurella atlantica]MBR0573679.1 phage minor tail protein L [Pasteurella atlantica]MDP8039688.1 phage minor tail protein L [Pasteurella atlantica]MDP8041779.1 phage minor tail protein L [Pasteurella atlantica]MDP8043947.1 phage minor tail protein L [Pasteurella atlantica]MDP8045925.1 phage minor tail protein L [Pasteurella atlantica]